MKTKEDIESYLIQLGIAYEEVGEGMWLTGAKEDAERIVVKYQPPVLVCRVNVMDLPKEHREELFQIVLQLNASEMMHGAYGLEGGKIVISDALQLENLDFNEFQATIDDITLAVADHYTRLAKFRADAAA
jgi:Putative bacterial sensory transduction regulator